MFDCSAEKSTHQVSISAVDEVIHMRLLLAPGGADIDSVEFQDATGKSLKNWTFD